MSKNKVKKIVKDYADSLKYNNYPFFAVYLFGSYAKDKQKKWSDIDVAVISDKLKKDEDRSRLLLWKLRRDIDLRIEPHGFTVKEFQNDTDPMVNEIKRTGVRVV